MRLSLQTDYALRMLMYLAVKDGHHSIAEISACYGISKNHMMKVAQKLVSLGLVRSVRGRSGGLLLGLPPDRINVGLVVRTLEDTSGFVDCFDPAGKGCIVSPACRLQHVLANGIETFMEHLDGFSVADLIGDKDAFRTTLNAAE